MLSDFIHVDQLMMDVAHEHEVVHVFAQQGDRTLTLARAVDDPVLSKEILAAARDAFGATRAGGVRECTCSPTSPRR
jgi:hypothetical protein